jgi:hypothetical protein
MQKSKAIKKTANASQPLKKKTTTKAHEKNSTRSQYWIFQPMILMKKTVLKAAAHKKMGVTQKNHSKI